MKMELTPGNHTKERIQYSEHGGSLKSRNLRLFQGLPQNLPAEHQKN